ncbi:hypothetical protein WJU16_20625 [Chitinophaga pollutisoli]|uniref:DUF1579 domain-containing protein n=1 Tax=Chitinophaga pollutisoli TaxID=3133966 RepID=A0ABZ2YN83_9BACT
MIKSIITSTVVFFLFTACRDTGRERALAEREQALLEKEQQFALKEAEYKFLIRWRDSLLAAADTLQALPPAAWPADVLGRWNSKTICRESGCSEYVVGDQRSGAWEFSGDSSGLFTKVYDRNTLVRVYAGTFDSSVIRLHFRPDSSAQRKVVMDVELSRSGTGTIKGTQLLKMENGCTARFAVELVRASNN